MKKVCVLGSGYAGLFSAANLLTDNDFKNKFEINIFDKNPYHQLLQQIHLVTAGIKKTSEISFPIHDLMKDDVKFYNDVVLGVNFNENKIITSNNKEYDFDYVIIALGASNAFFGIKGAKEYAQSFRSLNDALVLQNKIRNIKEDIKIIICGGGATGVSLAGALCETFKEKIKITIVEAQSDILPEWNPKLVRSIKNFLKQNNVEIITNNPIKEVRQSSVLLNNNTILENTLTIWTAGIKGQEIHTIPEIEKTKSNRIKVNNFSQIEGFSNAFALGDISAFPIDSLHLSPQLAQFAVRQAMNVAKNIIRREKGKEMVRFHFEQHGSILSLGRKCIGIMNGVIIKGSLCGYVEDFLIDNYITTIKNRGKGISSLAYEQHKLSQISSSLSFIISTASKILSSD